MSGSQPSRCPRDRPLGVVPEAGRLLTAPDEALDPPVVASLLRDVLLQIGAGLAVGIPLAIVAGRAARTMLFGVTPNDAGSYAVAAIVVTLMASAAAWIPVQRAASVDPLETLRTAA